MSLMNTLYNQHAQLLDFLSHLHTLCLDFLQNDQFDSSAFYNAITHIREFADGQHHKTEEQLLFRAMLHELGAPAVQLIQHGMLVEHDLARYYTEMLAQSIASYEQRPCSHNKLSVLGFAMSYHDLLHRHIQKENNAVYPYAERSLKPDTLHLLDEALCSNTSPLFDSL